MPSPSPSSTRIPPARPRRRNLATAPSTVAQVLQRALRARGWDARLQSVSLFHRWPELVGTEIARHSLPLRVHGGVLVVAVRHQAWATQLSFLRTDLLRRIRRDCGAAIRDILFQVQWHADLDQLSPLPDHPGACASPHSPPPAYDTREATAPPTAVPNDVFAAFRAWQTAADHRGARLPGLGPTAFHV